MIIFQSKVFNLVVLISISSTSTIIQSDKYIISQILIDLLKNKINQDKKFSIIDFDAIAIVTHQLTITLNNYIQKIIFIKIS